MPTYEYRCKDCGEHLEIVQSFRDDALTECPQCGGLLKKIFGNVGIVLKGSGFYKNDSRPAAAKSSESGGGKASEPGKPDSGSSPKSDAKPSAADTKPASDAKPTASPKSSSSAAS